MVRKRSSKQSSKRQSIRNKIKNKRGGGGPGATETKSDTQGPPQQKDQGAGGDEREKNPTTVGLDPKDMAAVVTAAIRETQDQLQQNQSTKTTTPDNRAAAEVSNGDNQSADGQLPAADVSKGDNQSADSQLPDNTTTTTTDDNPAAEGSEGDQQPATETINTGTGGRRRSKRKNGKKSKKNSKKGGSRKSKKIGRSHKNVSKNRRRR